MELSLSTWMMLAFIVFMILGIWKLYVFLPNRQLADDDKTEEAQYELTKLMLNVIKKRGEDITIKELFFAIQEDENFDSNLFWRFNHNRLNQLLNSYYIQNPNLSNIKDIHKKLNSFS